MIPSIESIINDLVAGTLVPSEAVARIYQHLEDVGLRDHFAGQALAGFCAADTMASKPELVATDAYDLANAMLAAREAQS